MPNDLASDTCIYIEAVTGDGGKSKGTEQWWASQDIVLKFGTMITNTVTQGQSYTVTVTGHWNANSALPGGCTLTTDNVSVLVDLWVHLPGMNLSPLSGASSIGQGIPLTGISPGNSASVDIPWKPDASDPNQAPGDKCLVARVRPSNVIPDNTVPYGIPDEPHTAQHNITVVAAPAGGKEGGPLRFTVSTVNLNREVAEETTIRVVADTNPSQHMLDVVNPLLGQVSSFKRIATTPPPQGFMLETPDFPNAQVRDNTKLFSLFGTGYLGVIWRWLLTIILFILGLFGFKYQATYEARFQMQPKQFSSFNLVANLTQATAGDAYIIHFMHVNAAQKVTGGFTLVAVVPHIPQFKSGMPS